jgi:hypothetical protein
MFALLDGSRLHEKVGTTLLLIACSPLRWPRLALLSVGEVLALSPRSVNLALYRSSQTTEAVARSGKALLFSVLDETVYKIDLSMERSHGGDEINTYFRGHVVGATADSVAYAAVTHGIEYELRDEESVLFRWRRQLELLGKEGER